jgi:kynurenine aminotransferase
VICIEPFFDQYFATIAFNGATPVFVPLHPPQGDSGKTSGADWTLDFDEYRAAFTSKTKAVIINTPHNPVGKVFTRAELEELAKICIEKDVLVIADEVYDCLVYDGKEHFRIASIPGMWERTLTVFSGGKSFAATGWRVGWLVGAQPLISATLAAHSRIVFCTNGPMQEAIAIGLEGAKEHDFFATQTNEYVERRDILCSYFDQLGLPYTTPEGSYFVLVDFSKVKVPDDFPIPDTCTVGRGADFKAAWFIANSKIRVVGIPVSECKCRRKIARTVPHVSRPCAHTRSLLGGQRQHWRALHPLCLLQGPRDTPRRRKAPSRPQGVHVMRTRTQGILTLIQITIFRTKTVDLARGRG